VRQLLVVCFSCTTVNTERRLEALDHDIVQDVSDKQLQRRRYVLRYHDNAVRRRRRRFYVVVLAQGRNFILLSVM